MSTTTHAALFSPDGATWRQPASPVIWPTQPDRSVKKIVLGTPPGRDEELEKITLAAPLPENLAELFPALTHLHLWQIAALETLPALPPGLRCLDVRGCQSLTTLPELPETLETLDVGRCVGLTRLPDDPLPNLSRFYFDGCDGLKEHRLAVFLESLCESNAPLVEIDGSGAAAVKSLEAFPPGKLRKLVLSGCEKLEELQMLGDFAVLDHLNLSGCTELRELPALPGALRFLCLHGADNLALFMGQDIGPYDRGGEGENVVAIFESRSKFGKELAIMPHAKLLLMGDGRVGKTTLAKRLQWEELDDEQRDDPAFRDLQPRRDQDYTHRVEFGQWETGLLLPDEEMARLEQRAETVNAKLPKTSDGHLDGAIRLWDFGGQELYHSTHRIFAGEGSIFLLLWTETAPEIGPPPSDIAPEEWDEWNRTRPLDYWLDYIDSIRPGAQIAVVCTHCENPDQMRSKPDWKTNAPKHREREFPVFFVDSLDERCGQHAEYQRLVKWVREACGREAQRIGILQPLFYRQVSDQLDRWLAENSRARSGDREPPHLLCPWDEWAAAVQQAYVGDAGRPRIVLDDDDINTITGYLHEAGHLFQIHHDSHRAILVDQDWAASLIYQILLCGGRLRTKVKGNGGWFYGVDLESDPTWAALKNDEQRSRLLAYMEECRVVTRIASADHQALGRDVYLASDKWLLPPYESVEAQVDRQMQVLREQANFINSEAFEFKELTVNEFDFRSLQALLARSFGTQALYFRNGFQAHGGGASPEWCFRVRWQATEDDPFAGKISGLLVAKRSITKSLSIWIEELFYQPGSPLAHERQRPLRRSPDPIELSHGFYRPLRQDEYDVAVSNSGQDREEASALVVALRDAGLNVNHYELKECRFEERRRVMDFIKSLGRQPCIVLLLSDSYLQDDPENNWYCAWELADAIIRHANGLRSDKQTIAVYKPSERLNSKTLNEVVVPLLKSMGQFFAAAYGAVKWEDQENFKYYDEFSDHFRQAVTGNNCRKFFEARGTLGSYLKIPSDLSAPNAFDAIVNEVLSALGKRTRT